MAEPLRPESEEGPAEEPEAPPRVWDYSTHPLKGGGATIVAVVVGTLVAVLLLGVVAVWLAFRH